MTVAELRKALDGLADDMPVATYSYGAFLPIEDASIYELRVHADFLLESEYSRHAPEQTVKAIKVFVVS